jgi:hypothetical protein
MQALDLSSSINHLYKSGNFLGGKTNFPSFSQKIEKRQNFAIRLFVAVVFLMSDFEFILYKNCQIS